MFIKNVNDVKIELVSGGLEHLIKEVMKKYFEKDFKCVIYDDFLVLELKEKKGEGKVLIETFNLRNVEINDDVFLKLMKQMRKEGIYQVKIMKQTCFFDVRIEVEVKKDNVKLKQWWWMT